MNKQTFNIHPDGKGVIANLIAAIRSLSRDVSWTVIIKPYKRDRTLAQNSLAWMWHTAYGKEYGTTKEDAHHEFKRHYVLPILLRDDEDGRLTRMWGMMEYADPEIREQFIDMLSTSMMSTKQFSEALTEYDMDTARKGLAFPHPDDMYDEAMIERMPAKYRRAG